MTSPFPYQHILLTGAASGIGRALLEQLAAFPVQLVVVDRDSERLAAALKALPSPVAQITPLAIDVSRPEQVDNMFQYALQAMGRIDLLIANAGFAYYERLQEPDWARLERIYRVNVFSPLYAAIKMKALNGSRSYKVVMTASAMAHMALPGYAVYASTKAALHRFAEAYRFELGDAQKLMLVYPIATRTNFFEAATAHRAPLPWPTQSPEQVARAVIVGLKRNQRAVYPSRLFRLHLFLERFFPFLRKLVQFREKRQFERWLKDSSEVSSGQ